MAYVVMGVGGPAGTVWLTAPNADGQYGLSSARADAALFKRMPDAQDAIEAIKRESAPPAIVFYVVREDR
jgi:hypothetical protein